jgi:hypothetical protein
VGGEKLFRAKRSNWKLSGKKPRQLSPTGPSLEIRPVSGRRPRQEVESHAFNAPAVSPVQSPSSFGRRQAQLRGPKGNPLHGAALSHQQNKGMEIEMSAPRYDRDPNRRATPVNEEATAGYSSIWVAAIVAILVIAGIAAYTYRNAQTASNPSATTSGQSTRAPASAPPVSTPAAPFSRANPAQRP